MSKQSDSAGRDRRARKENRAAQRRQVLTEAQLAANRQNAKKSTGPRTMRGKQRASRNAFRHGLTLPITGDPQFEEGARAFVSNLVGGQPGNREDLIEAARILAEAEARLARVRRAKRDVLNAVLTGGPARVTGYAMRSHDLLDRMCRLDRYEQRSRRRRDRAVRQWLLKIEVFGRDQRLERL